MNIQKITEDFVATVTNTEIDKQDLLFDIDNTHIPSMKRIVVKQRINASHFDTSEIKNMLISILKMRTIEYAKMYHNHQLHDRNLIISKTKIIGEHSYYECSAFFNIKKTEIDYVSDLNQIYVDMKNRKLEPIH